MKAEVSGAMKVIGSSEYQDYQNHLRCLLKVQISRHLSRATEPDSFGVGQDLLVQQALKDLR